jgi:hypothetical protein
MVTPIRILAAAAAVLVSLVAAWGSVAPPAHAEQPATWSLAPASATGPDGRSSITRLVEPGDVVQEHVSVRNYSDAALVLELYAADALTTETGGFDVLSGDEASTGVGQWTVVGQPVVELAPRGTALVPVTISVPSDAAPGDHAGGIVASITRSDTTVDVERRAGTRLYLRVGGVAQPRLEVLDVSVQHIGAVNPLDGGEVIVRYTALNSGNVRLSAAAALTVSSPLGIRNRSAADDAMDDLLPGARVSRTVRLPSSYPLGSVSVRVELRATASAEQDLADAGPVASGSASTTAVPYSAMVAAAALACAGLLLRRQLRRPTERPRR